MPEDSRLKRAGVTGFNKPKATPSHPTKSHVVVAKVGDQIKTIRFGQRLRQLKRKPRFVKQRFILTVPSTLSVIKLLPTF